MLCLRSRVGLALLAFLAVAPSHAQENVEECPYPVGRPIKDLPAALTAHQNWVEKRGWEDSAISGFANFCNADLRRANLEGARLYRANLEGANLEGTNLKGARLNWTNLERASLDGANLEGAFLNQAILKGALLSGANLEGAVLDDANLKSASLKNANMAESFLRRANLEGADLRLANLQGAYPFKARLEGADLRKAKLQSADLRKANLKEARLKEAHLEGADLQEAHLEAANLEEARLEGANLGWASFEGANLFLAHLEGADLFAARLEGANLLSARLERADLTLAMLQRAKLRLANLEGTNLELTSLEGADLVGATLTKAKLLQTDLTNAKLSAADLSEALYQPTTAPAQGWLTGLSGLRSIRFCPGEVSGLVQLREALKAAGLRGPEREATYALESNRTSYALAHWNGAFVSGCPRVERDRWVAVEGAFRLVLFEFAADYGLAYGRPIKILLGLIGAFTLIYLPALLLNPRQFDSSGIFRIWPEGRIKRSSAKLVVADEVVVERLTPRGFSVLGLAFYFSVISAFHLGWRDLNVGAWIARMQPREYALRAKGWVRFASGVQSLLSVYLIALWALTYFGRPFQ